jgi:ADP-heptose:LPS heptosyltransferase
MVDRSQFRDSYHYALAVASEIAAPGLRLVARAGSRSAPTPPASWRAGVIIGRDHIGDVLYRTCSLNALHSGLPECRWSYLTSASAAAVLAGNPAVADVLPWTSDGDGQHIDSTRRGELAKRLFDVALCSDNIAHHHAVMLALRLGIPNRVGFTRKGLSGLVTFGVATDGPTSHPAAFRRMVESVTGLPDPSPLRPMIYPSESDLRAADSEWTRLGLDDSELVIASAVTTRQSIGDFPPEFFTDVLHRVLILAPNARVLLNGAANDRPVLDAIAVELGRRAVVSAGSLQLLAYGAMLTRCAVFFGADSGPRHLANAANIPVFFVRNMGATEIGSGKYCPTEVDVAPPGEYLSPQAMRLALDTVDRAAVANAIVSAARRQARDSSEGTPS